jgi:hypothetical protein
MGARFQTRKNLFFIAIRPNVWTVRPLIAWLAEAFFVWFGGGGGKMTETQD